MCIPCGALKFVAGEKSKCSLTETKISIMSRVLSWSELGGGWG